MTLHSKVKKFSIISFSEQSFTYTRVFPPFFRRGGVPTSSFPLNFIKNLVQYTAFCLQNAVKIVSDGPSGHLKQSFQETFSPDKLILAAFKSCKFNEVAPWPCQKTQNISFLSFATVFV